MFYNSCIISITIIFLSVYRNSDAQNIPIGSWRSHLKHDQAYKVAEYNGKYFLITTSVVSYDPTDGSLKVLSKAEGFSDSEPVLIEPSVQHNLLMIVYKNGNIDLLKDNAIINLNDIKRKSIYSEVNQVYFHEQYAYLACNFGVVLLDLKSLLFLETYENLGAGGDKLDVNSLLIKDDTIFIATNKGLYSAYKNAPNLHDFLSWKRIKIDTQAPEVPVKKIVEYNDTLFINVDTLFYAYANGNWIKLPFSGSMNQMRATGDELIVIMKKGSFNSYRNTHFLLFWKNKSKYEIKSKFELTFTNDCIMGSDNNYWLAVSGYGLVEMDKNKNFLENFIYNGVATSNYTNMLSWEDELMVIFNNYFSVFKNGTWSNYQFKKKLNSSLAWEQVDGFQYIDPSYFVFYEMRSMLKTDDSKIFLGSYGRGLLVRDEQGVINTFSDTNSIFQSILNMTIIQDIKTDEKNNIWFVNSGTPAPMVVKTPDNIWYSFRPVVEREIKLLEKMVIDQQGKIWVTVQDESDGLLIFSHNNTLDDINDDQWKHITSFSGEGNSVKALAVDLDNRVWVGTDDGVSVFYSPEQIFDEGEIGSNCPIYEQRCLLSGQNINCIMVDSNNRKWFGTRSGAYLFNEDGTEKLYHFNIDNSPLLSNNVKQILIVTTSGEVFFNTDKGIVSYRSTATKSYSEQGFLNVFPNPVLPGYEGLIAISGLPFRATVKITDIAGKLVYETQAEGGTAIWNGKDSNQRKVQTGVYLVFISKEDGSELQVTKIAFIN